MTHSITFECLAMMLLVMLQDRDQRSSFLPVRGWGVHPETALVAGLGHQTLGDLSERPPVP